MVLVLMFLCDQSYTSHGRDFLLGVTILNSSALSDESGDVSGVKYMAQDSSQ